MRWLWLLVPGGSIVAVGLLLRYLLREQHEVDRADLVPRWAAFIEGEPRIPTLGLPPVKPLQARKVSRFKARSRVA